jgi:hypothetical protein
MLPHMQYINFIKKTWGFTILGWPYGNEEVLLPIWLFLY